MADSLYSAAVMNPIFQNAAKQSMFQQLGISETQPSNNQYNNGPNNVIEGVTEEQFAQMKKWANILKYMMLVVSTLMMITAYYNFANTSNSVASNFLAVYILFFSTMICCYEVAWSAISSRIVNNFGFLYNPVGRTIFYILVAIMLFQLSIMGEIIFAFLLCTMAVHFYVDFRFPKFEKYLRMTHLGMNPVVGTVTRV